MKLQKMTIVKRYNSAKLSQFNKMRICFLLVVVNYCFDFAIKLFIQHHIKHYF